MRCKKCRCWIYKGYEVVYRKNFYHELCAAEEAQANKPVTRKKKSHLRLIQGGKR